MSDITPPRKKSKFADLCASPQADAHAWSTYNKEHDEINTFIKGLLTRTLAAHLHAQWLSCRPPRHEVRTACLTP